MVETHSDHFVNRMGTVALGVVSSKDVQVVVVCEDDFGEAGVRIVEFDREGALGEAWPVGFFSPGH